MPYRLVHRQTQLSDGRPQRAIGSHTLRTLLACALPAGIVALPPAAMHPPAAFAYVPDDGPLGGIGRATGDPAIPLPFASGNDSISDGLTEDLDGLDMGEEGMGDDGVDDHSGPQDATSVPAPVRAHLRDVRYSTDGLPDAVVAARNALLQAARSGDIEALRPIFAAQRVPPLVADYGDVDDAVDHLRLQSGDPEGREILAILIELLESGFVEIGQKSTTTYVWPYFAEVPLGELEDRHYVEVYRILTAIDVEEVVRLGRYTFFRVGIAPDGRVRYFSAGELE
ncbi:MAG: hypothetical protein AAGJ94_07330 [Pseudomonadota bacterium]